MSSATPFAFHEEYASATVFAPKVPFMKKTMNYDSYETAMRSASARGSASEETNNFVMASIGEYWKVFTDAVGHIDANSAMWYGGVVAACVVSLIAVIGLCGCARLLWRKYCAMRAASQAGAAKSAGKRNGGLASTSARAAAASTAPKKSVHFAAGTAPPESTTPKHRGGMWHKCVMACKLWCKDLWCAAKLFIEILLRPLRCLWRKIRRPSKAEVFAKFTRCSTIMRTRTSSPPCSPRCASGAR